MKTIVVSVDFSDTALKAARYAAQWVANNRQTHMILYHHYTTEWERDLGKQEMEKLHESLLREFAVHAETILHMGEYLTEDLEKLLRHRDADLLVMGITGKGKLAQVMVGSNTLAMAEAKVCPVLIIPEEAEYRPVKHVLLASDFKEVQATTPLAPICKFLDMSRPQLHIVNVDPAHYIALTDAYREQLEALQNMFAAYNPDFHFMRLHDVDEAIKLLANDLQIDVIIAIRRNRSFVEKLFSTSRTRSLSYQTNVPMLLVHE